MERSRARLIIMWSAAVLYNARVARLLRSKKQGALTVESAPWSDKEERRADVSCWRGIAASGGRDGTTTCRE